MGLSPEHLHVAPPVVSLHVDLFGPPSSMVAGFQEDKGDVHFYDLALGAT